MDDPGREVYAMVCSLFARRNGVLGRLLVRIVAGSSASYGWEPMAAHIFCICGVYVSTTGGI